MFRYVPRERVQWRQAVAGGLLTAVLFTAGKYAIGAYISKTAVGSAYGAAGSVVVVIVWIYYTAQILFLGAEFTHVLGLEESRARDQDVVRPKDSRGQFTGTRTNTRVSLPRG
jgi:membrane protein